MTRKKKTFIIFFTILILISAIAVIKCLKSDKKLVEYIAPKLEIASMQVLHLDDKRADIKMSMQLNNSIPVSMKVDSIFYKVYIEQYEVVTASYPTPFLLPADSVYTLELPVTVYYDKLIKLLEKLDKKGIDSVVYRVDAIAYTNYMLKKKVDITTMRYLPLIKIPKASVEDIDIEDLSISGATLQVETVIYNPNIFYIGVKDLAFTLQLDDQDPIKGIVPGALNFPAMDSSRITIPIKMNFKETGKSIVDIIVKPRKIQYEFNAVMTLISGHYMIEDSKIILNAKGPLKEIREIQKKKKRSKEVKE